MPSTRGLYTQISNSGFGSGRKSSSRELILQLIAAGDAFRRVSMLRGRVKFSVGAKQLREDRG